MHRIGYRKEKLKEICILMGGREAWGLESRRSFLLLCFGNTLKRSCSVLPDVRKDSPYSWLCKQFFQVFSAHCWWSNPQAPTEDISLRHWQGTGIISLSPGLSLAGRTVAFWPLGGTVVSIVRSAVLWLDTSQPFKMEAGKKEKKIIKYNYSFLPLPYPNIKIHST